MAKFSGKDFALSLVGLIFAKIKPLFTDLQTTVETHTTTIADMQTEITTLTGLGGRFIGMYSATEDFPSTGIKTGDVVYLSDADGNATSVYKRAANGTWVLLTDIATFAEALSGLKASASDVTAGTATDKFMTVKQVVDFVDAALADIDLSTRALVAGDANQTFDVAQADIDSTQAVRADQFVLPTQAQVDAAYTAA